MANIHTTAGAGGEIDFSASLWYYYERKLLSVLEPRLVLQPLGRKQRLPKQMGTNVKWLRYASVPEATTPLTEGSPPSPRTLETGNVEATVKQYGDYSKVSDMLMDTSIDKVMKSFAERFGVAASKTIEALIVAELDAEAAIQHVNDRADDEVHAAGDVLNHKEIIEAMIEQKRAFIGPHESGKYVCVLNPASEFDLLSDNSTTGSFLDIRKYDRSEDLLKGEVGQMYGCRFLVSDKMSGVANGADDPNEDANKIAAVELFNNYMIGEEAFGVVSLDGKNVRMHRKALGSSGAADPLDQVATIGYKIHGFAVKALKDDGPTEDPWKRVIRIKASSALGDNS